MSSSVNIRNFCDFWLNEGLSLGSKSDPDQLGDGRGMGRSCRHARPRSAGSCSRPPPDGLLLHAIEEAAALCESLLQNHPFVDGNKRTAITATGVFLRLNTYELVFVDREMYDWLMKLYETGGVTKMAIDAWLRIHSAIV